MSRASSLDVTMNVPLLSPGARSRSRPRAARHSSANSISSIPQTPEDFINPGATTINEENAEFLHELLHPQHSAEDTLVDLSENDDDDDEVQDQDGEWRRKLPWWKRPSPWWFMAYVPVAAIAMTITAAAKVELFIYLVCQAHKPTYDPEQGGGEELVLVRRMVHHVVSTFADPGERACAQDPVVMAVVAKLTLAMSTIMGVLTCMTTAWWASLSDRFGRTKVLSCAVVGILMVDMTFLTVFLCYDYVPGGYWFLVLGPLVEGILGGQALINATIHAYIADTTPPAMRSGIFSLNLGLMMTGVGIGPVLGGLIIRFTGNFFIVFYISAAIHLVYALLVWFVIPESLSKMDMQEARARDKHMDDEWNTAHAHGGTLVFTKRLFSFLSPLALFLPIEATRSDNPAKRKKRDWSLLFVVVACGFTQSLIGLYAYIMQFLMGVYGWDTEQIGYWFSSLGATRAVFLTLILPAIVNFGNPKPIQLPTERDEPLTNHTTSELPASSPSPARPHATHNHQQQHSPKFDLRLARASLALDVFSYICMTLSPTAMLFAVSTAVGSLGMGFGPAVQSVALTLYNQRGGKDSGKLFGAMSVVGAMCTQVFGPFVYGMTYAKTVGTFPKAIFVVAGGALVTAFLLMMCVRLPSDAHVAADRDVEEQQLRVADADAPRVEREETLVGPPGPLIVVDDEDRGRKVIKP